MKFKERSYQKRLEQHSSKIHITFTGIMKEAEKNDSVGNYEISNTLIDTNVIFAVIPMLQNEGLECHFKGHLEDKNQSAYRLSWI